MSLKTRHTGTHLEEYQKLKVILLCSRPAWGTWDCLRIKNNIKGIWTRFSCHIFHIHSLNMESFSCSKLRLQKGNQFLAPVHCCGFSLCIREKLAQQRWTKTVIFIYHYLDRSSVKIHFFLLFLENVHCYPCIKILVGLEGKLTNVTVKTNKKTVN